MPIGFWAISRDEVKDMFRDCGNGQAPSSRALDKLVREIREALDTQLQEIVFRATQELRKRLP